MTAVQEHVERERVCVHVCVCSHIVDWKQIEIMLGIRFLKVTVNAEPPHLLVNPHPLRDPGDPQPKLSRGLG